MAVVARTSTAGGKGFAVTGSLAKRRMVIATMHGKEKAIAPVFHSRLGIESVSAAGLDTDVFGTFSGEIERRGTAIETAIAKARRGMALAETDAGLASEGAYGVHPVFSVIPGGTEVMAFVDDRLGITITESLIADRTNFSHCVVTPDEVPKEFLRTTGFPHHALVVRPNASRADAPDQIFKGIITPASLQKAVRHSASSSQDGRARIETDMRAHFNPTRMTVIKALAEKLAERLACECPRCATPGFGQIDRVTGLPCEECGGGTTLVKNFIYGCGRCSYAEERTRPDGLTHSSPTYCCNCNP